MTTCAICGKNLELVGRSHLCVPAPSIGKVFTAAELEREISDATKVTKKAATKAATKVAATKVVDNPPRPKMGRPLAGDKRMTCSERSKRSRAMARARALAIPQDPE